MDTRCASLRALRRSLLASFTVHATLVLTLIALLQPAGRGPRRPLELEVSVVEPPPEPETLIVSEALLPPNAGERLTELDSDLFAEAGESTDVVAPNLLWPSGRNGSGDSAAAQSASGPGASFFGTVAKGDEFVFVVDMSSSMDRGQGRSAGEGSRFVRAVAELRSSFPRATRGTPRPRKPSR